MTRILVTGAGGFIGHHLVKRFRAEGFWVRGVDIKRPEFEQTHANEFELLDLRRWDSCLQAVRGIDHVYALAADMGGMGFISKYHAEILYNNALISFHTLEAARMANVTRYLYTSSACIYPEYKQLEPNTALKEDDAYPADPQDEYGWEKLITERLCMRYAERYGMTTRIVRLHNVYGPLGTWRGGREKAPAAISRKVASAKLKNDPAIEVWGDGEATRSFLYIDDCLEGIIRTANSSHASPINLGQDEDISVNGLVDLVADIAGYPVIKNHIEGPQGVRGRNSDNTLLKQVLDWVPTTSLRDGLTQTYKWVEDQVRCAG